MAKESSSVEKKDRRPKAGKRSKSAGLGSPGPAPENAYLHEEIQRLRKETERRATELAIINSVQEGLAAGLASEQGIQALYDLVGDKIRDFFNAQTIMFASYDFATQTRQLNYHFEKGQRFYSEPAPLSELHKALIRNGKTLVFNENTIEELTKLGSIVTPGSEAARSAVFVPLTIGNRVFGVISLQNIDNEHAFPEADVRLLETLAASLGVALENTRLFDETQRLLKETEQRNAELAIVNDVQAGLASKLDVQAIYDLVGDKLRDTFDVQAIVLATYDYDLEKINVRYNYEKGERYYIEPFPFTPLTRYLIENKQTLVFNENLAENIAKLTGSSPLVVSGELPKSAIYIPLIRTNQVQGFIHLANSDKENLFSASDVRLLQTLTNSMSIVIENVRLFDETQHLLKQTEQRATELAIINDVQEGLASKLDMQAIYDLVGDKIHDLFNAQSILIVTFDPATRTREIKYNFEKGQRYYISELFPYNKLTEHLIDTKKTVVINRDAKVRVAEFGMVLSPGTEAMKSGVFVPLLAGEEVKGFISVQNVELENAFSESDVNLLSTFASSMSVALENARLYQEQLQVAEELKRVDRMKTQFLSSMSHELRTPLNAIINFVEMMARGMIGPVNPDQEELLNQTLDSSKHLLHLINDVLDISKIQAGRLALFLEDGVNLQEEVEGVLNIVSGLAKEKGLQLIRDIDPHLPIIACDRRRVRQVLLNLLSNAIKFSEQGTVTLSVKKRQREVLFAVIDTGPGIPPAKHALIFEPFTQGEDGAKAIQGTGLGLPISRSLVQAHGGELWLESRSGEGAAFFFNLPLHERRAA